MFVEQPAARRLAVATLTEAGAGSARFRSADGRPLQGYVMVTGEGTDCRITVYLDRGEGTHTAVLAGEMVWLQTHTADEAAEAPVPLMQAAGATAEPWAGLLAGAGSPAASAAEPAQPAPAPEPEPERPAEEQPAEVGFKLYHEPAVPISAVPPHKIEVIVTPVDTEAAEAAESPTGEPAAAPAAVTMASRHPLAPRAGGTARLDFAAGRLVLTVRGLPSPAMLGRTYNAYRAWLLNQRAGTRQPLGLLTRVWGENFKLESEPDLPFDRYDSVLVTAEDRAAPAPSSGAPQVLLGDYARQ
ncbi:MAG TPA: hypothetical protein VNT01_17875 [Symbiobacteriaceae bacterium]|nr:hypothetical protein [Symbiobacteriaceae bacterium]